MANRVPHDPANLIVTQAPKPTTATTFAGLSQMLSSTFMVTYLSFFDLGSVLGLFVLVH